MTIIGRHRTSAVTVLLCYFTYLREPVLLKLRFYTYYVLIQPWHKRSCDQDFIVTQTVQEELISHSDVAKFLKRVSARNYENRSTYAKKTKWALWRFFETVLL